jgi:tetratricopeptide (TPR) repeat protein
MRFFCLAILLASGTVCPVLADNAGDFANANREYAAGHYPAATDGYEALIRSGARNAAVFYNLGNSFYRRGDLARAILNYERALALDPRHPEATANLHLVRDQSRALELTPSPLERFLGSIDPAPYSWTAAAAFWITLLALAVMLFRRSRTALASMILAILLFGCAIYALYVVDYGDRGQSLAIVTGRRVDARVATADNANSVLALPPGSEVKILSTRGDWSYAALPNSLRGWVPTSSVESVRL